VRLGSGSLTLGAGSGAGLIVASPTVSRAHVELTLCEEGVRVRDLNSRNGTFYLGQRIDTMVLSPGSRIVLGSVEVVIEPDPASIDGRAAQETAYRGILGVSPALRKIFSTLARLEGSLVNVLVTGESGAGKEVVARALHQGSAVASGPLVVKNCAAMSRELALSELFGHKKGAFTGAVEAREGAFQAANGGTLFLDEIGELPLDVQPTLLRALELGEVTPVGATLASKVRVRIIAATNRNLEEAVRAGSFREDLYYRLAVVKVRVPALRERPEDIPALAHHFARSAGLSAVPGDVVAQWQMHDWPGNVRELRNAVEAFVALGGLPDESPAGAPTGGGAIRGLVDLERPLMEQREAVVEQFTRAYLLALMERTGGNQSEASRVSGVERSHLRKLLIKHGLLR
jgi:two-component system, NtrC family, response regulator GlrR